MHLRRHVLPPIFPILLLTACSRSTPAAHEEEETRAPVHVARATTAPLEEWTEIMGATQPLPGQAARITSMLEGQVQTVLVDDKGHALTEGQRVAKGQQVALLDDRPARARREKILASLEESKEGKRQADLAYKLAALDLERLEKLNPSSGNDAGLVSKIEIDRARLSLQDAESKQKGALARERTLRAELDGLDLQLEQCQLRSPIAGFLGPLHVVPGQTLAVGALVAEIINLDDIDAVGFVPAHLAGKLGLDQPAVLAGDSESDKAGPKGKVIYIAAQAQPDTGSFLVKVRFSNRALRLRANQVARIRVQTQEEKPRLTIPADALLEDQDPPAVVVVHDIQTIKDHDGANKKVGKAQRLNAHVGVRDRSRRLVEILELEEPEKKEHVDIREAVFVVEGAHGLHDDDAVVIEEEKEEKQEK